MKYALIAVALLIPVGAYAQQPTSFTAKYYNVGAAQPLQSDTFPVTDVVCNQAAPAAGASTVNPTRIVFADINNAGRVCIYTTAGGAQLRSLPVGGNYEGTLTAVNAAGSSAESARAGFSRLGPPVVPTALGFIQ